MIPPAIAAITLRYIDDHFLMYRGSFEWKINDAHLLANILSAPPEQVFFSAVFEIAKLQWMLRLYPNGHAAATSPNGQFNIFLETLSMPSSWDHILLCQSIRLQELDITGEHIFGEFRYIHKFKVYEYWGWSVDTISLAHINAARPRSLTFKTRIKILRIVAKSEPDRIALDSSTHYLKYQSRLNDYRAHYKLAWKV